ncbi:MAG: PH domain-containing protein [Candidatus Marinimicrobia bacterium]|nr:PH domain-containing protein [Candidatus Neomarinimicrobiota bacterium]
MDLKPDISRLMKRNIYTFITISLSVILTTLIIQLLVVVLDPDVTNTEFILYVWPWVVGALFIFWILTPGLTYLWITNLKYSIEEERVVIQKGILTKQSVSIPYSAITDFTLSRSLYERWLGIGTLLVQTAGQGTQTGMYEGKLEGLIEYDDLYANLRAKVKTTRSGYHPAHPTDGQVKSDSELLQAILEEIKRIGRKLD